MAESIRIRVPDDFVAQVRDSDVAEDLELPNETTALAASYLYAFQNNEAYKDLLREKQNKENQRRTLIALRNSVRDTKGRLHGIMADPVLSRRLLEAYGGREGAEAAYFKPAICGHDLYVGKIDVPEDPESALLQLIGQLSILSDALESLDPEPSPNTTRAC